MMVVSWNHAVSQIWYDYYKNDLSVKTSTLRNNSENTSCADDGGKNVETMPFPEFYMVDVIVIII